MAIKAGKYHKGAQIFNGGAPKTPAATNNHGNLSNKAPGVDFTHMGPEGHDPMGSHRVPGHKPAMPTKC